MVAITCFFDAVSLDVDNVPKPVLDALKGVVYTDDTHVTDLICRKRDIKLTAWPNEAIQDESPALLEAIKGRQQFLHIRVADAPTEEVLPWQST